MMVIPETRRAH